MVRPHSVTRSKKFSVKQQQEWYEILKQDGFVDIELFDPVNGRARLHLSQKGSVKAVSFDPDLEVSGVVVDPSGKAQYYECVSELNHIIDRDGFHIFDSYEDQVIWRLHSEGLTQTKIAERIKRPQMFVSRKISKYKPLITNKLLLPSVKEVDKMFNAAYSEDSEYEVVDYCKDPLKTTEDVMINCIERERAGIRTREVGYYEDIEENLRNRYTDYRLIERLVELDGKQTKDSLRVRYDDSEYTEGVPIDNTGVLEYTVPDPGKGFHSM